MQHYICLVCGVDWSRETVKGRVPKMCPTCRQAFLLGSKCTRLCLACEKPGARKDGKFCSQACALHWRGHRTPVPVTHPSRTSPRTGRHVERITQGPRTVECPRCASVFVTTRPTRVFCSNRCQDKEHRLRRRVREAASYGDWRWSDFMRIAQRFDYCCAYCGVKPDRLDPDHVVPLSKGGPNTLNNLLPTCAACNSDKGARSLNEWTQWRAARGKPSLATTWEAADPRYWHLTSQSVAA